MNDDPTQNSRRRTQFSVTAILMAVMALAIVFGLSRFMLKTPVPPAIVEGRVVYDRDGGPAGYVVVHAQRISGQEPYAFGQALTDGDGYYQLPKIPSGEYNIWAAQSGYTVQALESISCSDVTPVADLRLVRGAIIIGRVVDAATGEPIRVAASTQRMIGLKGPSRPESGAAIEATPVQADGTFILRAAPGQNLVYATWVRGTSDLPASVSVKIADGQTIDIELKVPSEGQGDNGAPEPD